MQLMHMLALFGLIGVEHTQHKLGSEGNGSQRAHQVERIYILHSVLLVRIIHGWLLRK